MTATVPSLIAELLTLTKAIATAPTELAADTLRIQRAAVGDELVRRTAVSSW
jgi:hypothetical protein